MLGMVGFKFLSDMGHFGISRDDYALIQPKVFVFFGELLICWIDHSCLPTALLQQIGQKSFPPTNIGDTARSKGLGQPEMEQLEAKFFHSGDFPDPLCLFDRSCKIGTNSIRSISNWKDWIFECSIIRCPHHLREIRE